MTESWIDQHRTLTRRYFLQSGTAALAAAGWAGSAAADNSQTAQDALQEAIDRLEYLTTQKDFGTVERGDPLPYTLPADQLAAAGLTRDTWKLEVVADPDSDAVLDNPLSREAGNPLDFAGLMKLAEKHAVRFLKIMTCQNGGSPLGVGLWEGVPLRHVVWQTKPRENVRRVFFHGYHNEKPEQLFQSSLPVGRVLEDPPGQPPVCLCYKLNGEWLTGKRGGPVRMLIPEGYGFKSIKWLNRVLLTNLFHANDTYARGNNDVDSWLKTFARFIAHPRKVPAGEPVAVTGLAQVGISGLSRVQVWAHPRGTDLPPDDPYLQKGDWIDAQILDPPDAWGAELGNTPLTSAWNFNSEGKPQEWPQRYALAHWAVLLPKLAPGRYELRCRTIDANGIAQPLPRPFRKSGRNDIERASLVIEG